MTEPEPVEDAEVPERAPLPTHKDELVELAIARGVPSYEAWDMTVPALTKMLEA